jgi:hypothetical protein
MKKLFSINLILSLTILIICTFFTATEAEVVEKQGTGEVTSVELQTNSIVLEIDDLICPLRTNKDTIFKGVKSLQDVKKEDKVFVKYKIDDHGRKFLISLEKK